MNISSIIVRAKRDDWENLLEEIGKVAYSEVALEDRDKGVIIATIEAPDTGADIQSLKQISALRGVLSADMHLSYMQDLEECRLDINEIAELIDTKPIAEMKYSGDVKNFLK
ncbi:chaperone NapD [uncultured Helicobacter sp.]|uniref:chaperone NapD n=1 Tax=uncultured Helicobacter sp. TaxID=175537 RepID=UPI001C3A7E52|nr:chaperone NapD [Candidatus Helicobacter avicola]